MENKKDIGKAISDRLDSLDKSPREQVWAGINEELLKRKKKRRIGFFFFWSKALSILLIGTIAAFYIYNQNNSSNEVSPNNSKESISVSTDVENNKNNVIPDKANQKSVKGLVTNDSNFEDNGQNTSNDGISTNTSGSTSVKKNIIQKRDNKNGNTLGDKIGSRNNLSTGRNNESHMSSKPNNYLPAPTSKIRLKKSKGKISQKEKIYRSKKSKKENLLTATSEKDKKTETEVDLSSLQGKGNIEIASEAKEKTKKKDSVAKKQEDKEVTVNMFPKDSLKEDKTKYQKFYFDAFVSPTMYGGFSSGSLLDKSLDSLPKRSEIKFSYGFGISYDLSKRFSVRIGFQRVNITYVTKNAFLSQNEIQILDYTGIGYNTNISNETIYNASGIDPNQMFKMDITQKFTYTEIPIEFKYKFLDKKLALKSSCGFSYLILNENSISVKTINGFEQQIGKTKDMSSTAFSLNLGLELEYPIFKNVSIFAEPMLNYMVKAASSGSYNPYIFGIHTGIRISFNN